MHLYDVVRPRPSSRLLHSRQDISTDQFASELRRDWDSAGTIRFVAGTDLRLPDLLPIEILSVVVESGDVDLVCYHYSANHGGCSIPLFHVLSDQVS